MTLQDSDSSAKTSAAAVRIRENQRRSRARRKEYVEGMQRKLQEYETKGVAATLEMQQAARHVAIENSRLRLLLAHNGISSMAIDGFLQSFKGQDGAEAEAEAEAQVASIAAAESVAALGQAAAAAAASSSMSSSSAASSSSSATMATLFPEHAHVDKLAVLASASVQQSSCSGSESQGTMTPDDSTTTPSTGPVTPNSSSLNSPSPGGDQDFDTPMEMSCDAAAQIIAQMQGHCEMAKGGLGCGGQDEYLVQNSAFLKILEAASIFN